MKQVYINAIAIIEMKINLLGHNLKHVNNEYSMYHLNTELKLLNNLKHIIIKRSGINKNVIYVDFINKKRVA